MKARLPDEIRPQEGRRSRREREIVHEAIGYASELAIAVIANLLIEKHGWGAGKNSTRLRGLIDDFIKVIDEAGERYGYDCVMTQQMSRLRDHGIDLHVR